MMWFYDSGLPELLQRKLPLVGYEARSSAARKVDVHVTVDSETGPVSVLYGDLPAPDDSGVFRIDDRRLVVVPVAETEDFAIGRILCVGRQLLADLEDRIVDASTAIEWDEDLLRKLIPLEHLILDFLEVTGQVLDDNNWYSRTTHLRRILNPNMQKLLPNSQIGCVCPIDTPEAGFPGDAVRIGRVLTLSRGTAIEDDKVSIRSDVPVDRLGPVTATIPFLEYTEPVRAQIGVNLMRQWRRSSESEPALVQTGFEPVDQGFWIGHNLLTAFTSFGKYTFEDSIAVSESAAVRLGFTPDTCIGAKMSNRSGQKGVVGVVVPDEEMPRLPDGTPVEMVVSFIGLHTRMNCGQLYEAAASWIAKESGNPYIASPFSHTAAEKIEKELPEAPYLCRLLYSGTGQETDLECLAGWVYWGVCMFHAENRLTVFSKTGLEGGMRQGEMESHVLIHRGAYRILQERFTDLAAEKRNKSPWSALFDTMQRRLSAAGIRIKIDNSELSTEFTKPTGNVLRLAVPLVHPWLSEQTIEVVGAEPEVEGWEELEKANRALTETPVMPGNLKSKRIERLQSLLNEYFSNLLTRKDMRLGNRIRGSARGVISVGTTLKYDEVGIPRRMSRDLFGSEELPDWVIINRAPTMENTAVTAFRPVVVEGDTVRLNPFVCRWMNADYDGDQVAVLVPDSPETQEEAGRLLSAVGHVTAEGRHLDNFAPTQESMWGLSRMWLSTKGRHELQGILPALQTSVSILTRKHLVDALRSFLEQKGAVPAIEKAVELWERGFAEATRAGGTLNPFTLARTLLPKQPDSDCRDAWDQHIEHCIQTLASTNDFVNPAYGPQLLAGRSGARGTESNIVYLVAGRGFLEDSQGRKTIVKSGLLSGLTFDEFFALAVNNHERIIEVMSQWLNMESHPGFPDFRRYEPGGIHVIARAMRSKYPGIVFARAAAAGEVDPLLDTDTRLFLGMLPKAQSSS
jgi:hypothetical protein